MKLTENKSIYKLENDRPPSVNDVGTFVIMDLHDMVETYYMVGEELKRIGILTD